MVNNRVEVNKVILEYAEVPEYDYDYMLQVFKKKNKYTKLVPETVHCIM